MKATLRAAMGAVGLAVVLAACTPAEMARYSAVTEPTRSALSNPALARLRSCESGGSYSIVSGNGAYRGAYQFSRSTWDSVARQHYPWLIGMDPARAPWYWQDAMARALFSEAGRSPWPVCGPRI